MSSGSGRKGRPVSNPYAKRRKNETGHTLSSPNATKHYALGDINYVPGSFSQAFESIDNTSGYRRASRSLQDHLKNKQSDRDDVSSNANCKTTETMVFKAVGSNEVSGEIQKKTDVNATDDIRIHHTMLQRHILYVGLKQKGNTVLALIRNVPIAYSKMVPDYIMGPTTCALFLSIRYHKLYPQYIHRRISELGKDFKLRILLVYVDMDDNTTALNQINLIGVRNNFTVILCWSELECARYLETYKMKDGKTDVSCITKKESTNIVDQVSDFLTSGHRGIGGVNKTDCLTLMHSFGSVAALTKATKDELALCPGMGSMKIRRLHEAFHRPFSTLQARKRKKKVQDNRRENGKKLAKFETKPKDNSIIDGLSSEGKEQTSRSVSISIIGNHDNDQKGNE